MLGIAGVDGNGQTELADVITGLRRAEAGRVTLLGEDITSATPLQIIEKRSRTSRPIATKWGCSWACPSPKT